MILEVQNGCFGYPKQPVILESINLSLEEGHILAILGPNGIGKTTLLKCMIGLLPWHSGKTLLYGKDIHTLKPKDVWSTISYIPQSRGFAFSYTGLEMVLLGRSAHLGAFQQPGKEEIESTGIPKNRNLIQRKLTVYGMVLHTAKPEQKKCYVQNLTWITIRY